MRSRKRSNNQKELGEILALASASQFVLFFFFASGFQSLRNGFRRFNLACFILPFLEMMLFILAFLSFTSGKVCCLAVTFLLHVSFSLKVCDSQHHPSVLFLLSLLILSSLTHSYFTQRLLSWSFLRFSLSCFLSVQVLFLLFSLFFFPLCLSLSFFVLFCLFVCLFVFVLFRFCILAVLKTSRCKRPHGFIRVNFFGKTK